MPEGLVTADGAPLDLAASDKEFAAAMAEPAGPVKDAPPKATKKPVDAPPRPRGRPAQG